jgi:hypothetical protein
VLYVNVRARHVGDEAAPTPRLPAPPPLQARVESCVIELRLAAPAAPANTLWQHGDLSYPCPGPGSVHTLVPRGAWVALRWREERVPLGSLLRRGLREGRYTLSASVVVGLYTGAMHPPLGPDRARWSPDPGLRCAWACTVTVPAGLLRIRY